jgi:predicted nuclease with TOPRIM domain
MEEQPTVGQVYSAVLQLNDFMQAFARNVDRRFAGVDSRLESFDGRLTRIEGRLENVEGRLTNVEGCLTNVERRLTNLEDEFVLLRTSMNDGFRKLETRVGVLEARI